MSREQEKIPRRSEKNPAEECNKIRQKYCPHLFQDFAGTKDPRHQSHIDDTNPTRKCWEQYMVKGLRELLESFGEQLTREDISVNSGERNIIFR